MTTSRALRRASAATAAAALGLAGAAFAVQPAMAATLTVTSLDDIGPDTLRQAILDANAAPGPDTITFGVTGTIELLSPIVITDELTIQGPGVDALTITRDGSFDLLVFDPAAAADLSISGIDFRDDQEDEADLGRALWTGDAAADVSIAASSFTGFMTSGNGGAVSIGSDGTTSADSLTVTDVVATENVSDGGEGGAFFVRTSGNATFSGFTAVDNYAGRDGGAVEVVSAGGRVDVISSAFTSNESDLYGGAIQIDEVLNGASIVDSTFVENFSQDDAGAVEFEDVYSDVVVSGSTFESNTSFQGGGLQLWYGEFEAGEEFTVVDSTFTGNTATWGAGFGFQAFALDDQTDPLVVIDSSTFYGNEAVATPGLEDAAGVGVFGELYRGGTAHIVNSTFDETSSLTPAPGAIAVLEILDEANDVEKAPSTLEVVHSTVIGPSSILQLRNADAPEGGAVLASHDVLASVVDADALSTAIIVEEEEPEPGVQGESARAEGRDFAFSDAAPAAGQPLSELGFTVEWSVVTTGVDPLTVTQGAGNQLEVADVGLAPLADNGGATLTRLPADTSPAVNTGDPAVEGAPETDQRGAARIVETIDVGAVELAAPEPSLAATGGTVNWTLMIGAAGVLLLGAAGLVIARTRKA